jgi:hypothetical protein
MSRTRVYTNFGPRAQQRGGQPAAPVNPWAQLLHFLPILLLVAFTFFSTQSEPVRPPCSAGHCTCRPPCAAVPTFYAVFCTSSSCILHQPSVGGVGCCPCCAVSMSGPSGRSVMLRYQLLCGTPVLSNGTIAVSA